MTSEKSISESPSSPIWANSEWLQSKTTSSWVFCLFIWIPNLCVGVCVCQIAPAESPDVTERMVIITGTPEAQFKVKSNAKKVHINMR